MAKVNVQAMITKLRREQAKLSKSRDVLRDLISDIEAVENDASEAVDSLEYAIDALSRLQ